MKDLFVENITIGKYKVYLIKDDLYIALTLKNGHEWDGWMRQDIAHLYMPGTDIIDIGGNIGWNALMFSDYGPVHTFEPLYHQLVQMNIDQNDTTHPITCYPYGLSSRDDDIHMYIPKPQDYGRINYGGSSMTFSEAHQEGSDTLVHIKKLDDVYTGTPSFMKIDVEGHELDVIKGAWKTINTHLPSMYVEIFDADSDIFTMLKDIGYLVFERPEKNFLFVHINAKHFFTPNSSASASNEVH